MIFPSRKPIGKQADHTDGASGGCHQGRPGRNPAPRTSARSNGTTSFSTASTSSIVPGAAKERVLMLYFNTNVGATLVWVNPIDPLAMKTANPRAEPLPEHGEGREVQLGVAMGVSVMLLRIDLGDLRSATFEESLHPSSVTLTWAFSGKRLWNRSYAAASRRARNRPPSSAFAGSRARLKKSARRAVHSGSGRKKSASWRYRRLPSTHRFPRRSSSRTATTTAHS